MPVIHLVRSLDNPRTVCGVEHRNLAITFTKHLCNCERCLGDPQVRTGLTR